MNFDIVLFDFDGTLADSKEDVWESVEYSCSYFNAKVPREFKMDPSNLSLNEKELFAILCPNAPRELLGEFSKRIEVHYRKINKFTNTKLYPGIEKILVKLNQNNIPCFIASNKPQEPLNKIIIEKGWDNYFEKWISPDFIEGETMSKKEMIKYLIKNFDSESRIVYIGDSYTDIIASKANKIMSIGVLYGDGKPELVKNEYPDFIANNIDELYEIIFQDAIRME